MVRAFYWTPETIYKYNKTEFEFWASAALQTLENKQ